MDADLAQRRRPKDSCGILEIKKKSKTLISSIEFSFKFTAVVNYIEKGLQHQTISDERVKTEAELLQERYGFKPKMVISYDRYSMKGPEETHYIPHPLP